MKDILDKAKKIKLLVFDVDGVLTDGCLIVGDDGKEYKSFYAKDGLGIKHIYQGQLDKLPAFEEILKKLNLTAEQAAYVGDDIIDLPVMLRAGLAVTVADAHLLVKQHAHWQTPQRGGRGAARDVCELIMQAQGTLEAQFQKYLSSKN